jgi:hypothetical protein
MATAIKIHKKGNGFLAFQVSIDFESGLIGRGFLLWRDIK